MARVKKKDIEVTWIIDSREQDIKYTKDLEILEYQTIN